jgi:two-component system CheB/CheR fusion protein
VLIDDDLRIVRTRGHTAPFLALPEGDASLDLFKMAHRSLLPALRSAIDEALASGNATVRQTELPAPLDGDGASAPGTTVTIEVIPYTHREARCFLVTFARHGDLLASHDGEPGARPPVRTHGPTEGTIAQLERELAASHRELEANVRDLAATNEELQSANEEILSSNEELQSTNEELDTAKEELQSTNEELSSLNDQLHGRNEELREANNDLANLLSSVRIPIVMVSNDLRIRRFTPAAEGVLNLIASDVGRPIGHIRPNLIHANLESFLAEVMGDVAPREQEVEDGAGRIYSMRVQPCRNGEGDVWGAVLSLVDISSAKLALRLATETAETVMSSVREPSVLLDATLRITHANPAFRRAFGGDGPGAQELQGRPVNELDDGRWNHPALVRALRGVLPERTNFEGLTVELGPSAKSEGGKKVLSFDARRIESGDHGGGVILLMVR